MTVNILVVGRDAEILETILRLIRSQEGWTATGARTDDEAVAAFKISRFNVVLIGGGVTEAAEQSLRKQFKEINPDVKIVQHFGGGSGLLFAEIFEALSGRA